MLLSIYFNISVRTREHPGGMWRAKHSECLRMSADTLIDTSDSPRKQVLFVWSTAMVTSSVREGEDCV